MTARRPLRSGCSLTRRTVLGALPALLGACGGAQRALDPGDEPDAAQAAPARLALVLSGGGLRGLAHLGALFGLRALGIEPDLVVGVSIGAVVGGLAASGCTLEALERIGLPAQLDPWGSLLMSPTQRSRRLESLLREQLAHARIEAFERRFAALATVRSSAAPLLLGSGDAARALVASAALPGALAPVRVRGVELVDGGLSQPLPVRAARALGAQRVIAVDVSWHPQSPPPDGRLDSLFHAGFLMARNLAASDRAQADVLIDPLLPPVPEVTLANRDRLIACGEQAVRAQAQALIALAQSACDSHNAIAVPPSRGPGQWCSPARPPGASS